MGFPLKTMYQIYLIAVFLPGLLTARDYRGGELRTLDSYKYGRFEVRMKSAVGNGLLASFFTYHDGGVKWNEIDIEILGQYNDEVQFNVITPNPDNPNNTKFHVYTETVDFNPHADFHTYAIEWTPYFVRWFMDGMEVYTQDGSVMPHIVDLTEVQKIMFNIWQPTYVDWVGEFDESILPVYAYYDWVKYYSYQPNTGDYGSGNMFKLEWSDDFNFWNVNRWAKATHTFDGNNCDFIPENVVFYAGQVILCLTTPDSTGYHPEEPLIQDKSLYNNFEGGDSLVWGFWTGSNDFYPSPVDNPDPDSTNSSAAVFNWYRMSNSSPYTNAFVVLPEKLDLSINHTFSLLAYTDAPNIPVTIKLQNNDLEEPWTTETTVTCIVPEANKWTACTFKFVAALGRTDIDRLIIQFNGESVGAGNYYFDDLYGPPTGIAINAFDSQEYRATIGSISLSCYPNPSNPITTIEYNLSAATYVNLAIYDLLGRRIKSLVDKFEEPGPKIVMWDGTDRFGDLVSTGVYISRIQAGKIVETNKLVLIK